MAERGNTSNHENTTKTMSSTEDILEQLVLPPKMFAVSLVGKGELLFVSALMILLWVGYVLCIGWAGASLAQFAVQHVSWVRGAQAGFLSTLWFVLPLLFGVPCLLLMIRVLFPHTEEDLQTQTLTRKQEPFLYDFVEKICSMLEVTLPVRIEVDNRLEVFVDLHTPEQTGARKELLIRFGLPLVAALDLRQMTGMLVHEVSRFRDRIGQTLSSFILSMYRWFLRAVFERDVWDERLQLASHMPVVGVLLFPLRLFTWLNRSLLWLLMVFAHMVSFSTLRRSLFQADRREVLWMGTESFIERLVRLRMLGYAAESAYHDLEQSWNDGQLGDDLSALIATELEQLSAEIKGQAKEEAEHAEGLFFEPFPSDSERISHARVLDEGGSFSVKGQASILFQDFASCSEEMTLTTYQELLGDEIQRSNLIPTASLLEKQRMVSQEAESLMRFFQGAFSILRMPVFPMLPERPTMDAEQAVPEFQELRRQIKKEAPETCEALEQYELSHSLKQNAVLMEYLQEAGLTHQVDALGRAFGDIQSPEEAM